jgi:hypothetical protein
MGRAWLEKNMIVYFHGVSQINNSMSPLVKNIVQILCILWDLMKSTKQDWVQDEMKKSLNADLRKHRLSGNFHPDTTFFQWGHSCTISVRKIFPTSKSLLHFHHKGVSQIYTLCNSRHCWETSYHWTPGDTYSYKVIDGIDWANIAYK